MPRGHLDFERGVILRELEEVEKTTEEASAAKQLSVLTPLFRATCCTLMFVKPEAGDF